MSKKACVTESNKRSETERERNWSTGIINTMKNKPFYLSAVRKDERFKIHGLTASPKGYLVKQREHASLSFSDQLLDCLVCRFHMLPRGGENNVFLTTKCSHLNAGGKPASEVLS